jgi:hypothetical protein
VMKRFRMSRPVLGIAILFIAVFGIGAGRSLTAAPTMRHMPQNMAQGQCLSSCGTQHVAQPQPIAPESTTVEVDDQSLKPQPVEPYYLAFMGVGWTTVITVAAAYVIKYLRWRPPDLYKLNVAYRF